jgi:hypothetical protein
MIPIFIIEKYVETIFFLMEIDCTCMEGVEPREIFIHTLTYEVE